MSASIHLLLHNFGMVISGIVAVGLSIFSLVNNPKKQANVMMSLFMLAVAVFIFSHVIGVNLTDHIASRNVLMFNVSIIFVVLFNVHTVYALLGIDKRRKNMLIFFYVIGVSLALFYVIFPDTFLLASVPKMYFPNYYNPGQYQWLMRVIFDIIIPLYFMYELIHAYRHSNDPIELNRFRYFFFALTLGYGIGSIPILLVYNIQVDPAWGGLFIFFYAIPHVYAVVEYELLDIHIIAKRAFYYALSITIVGSVIIFFNLANEYIQNINPDFPFWIMPLVSAILAVAIGVSVWHRLKESEVLKYEFVTTVTHKFRTPLTHIKWATENLERLGKDPEAHAQLEYIKGSNNKLVELTNLLANVSESERTAYNYHIARTDLSTVTDDAILTVIDQIRVKHIQVVKNTPAGMFVECDPTRIKFIIQTFFENAINYTPDNATVTVTISRQKNDIVCSIKDTGIGIPKEELPLLFSKFYRGAQAKQADTEGMGIGLYISKQIIERHHGKIWASSEGIGKGSTFSISLPEVG